MIWASRNGYLEVVNRLVKYGADVNYQMNNGGTAFISACNNQRE